MKKLLVLLLIVAASAAWADKTKNKVKKEKHFEPAVLSVTEYVGTFRGPSPEHELVWGLAANGTLRGSYTEPGRTAVLDTFSLEGADFSARAVFDDGDIETFRGSFAYRVLDGVSAFGARVYGVKIPGMSDDVITFFERRSD